MNLLDNDSLRASIDALYHACVVKALDCEDDPQTYLRWARLEIPHLLPQGVSRAIADPENAAFWLGWHIWNCIPFESNRFRPRPLPDPSRNAPCPCGSGAKYKHCCVNHAGAALELPSEELVWGVLTNLQPERYWIDVAKAGRLPLRETVIVAHNLADAGRWQAVRKLAEARLADSKQIRSALAAHLIDPLCDALDHINKTDRNKLALLRRVAGHRLAPVSAAANRRLAQIHADRGDVAASQAALQQALRAEPKNPENALLELTLLATRGEMEILKDRARFWRRRLERDDQSDELLDFLELCERDPESAFDGLIREAMDPDLQEMIEWIDDIASRPIPKITWQSYGASEADDPAIRHAVVQTEAETALVQAWEEHAEADVPFGIEGFGDEYANMWEDVDRWLPWLESHPAAADQIEVLDDLIGALNSIGHEVPLGVTGPVGTLSARAVEMLTSNWPRDTEATLPWMIMANRPWLRALIAYLQVRGFDLSRPDLADLAEFYLRINPHDNHGVRAPYINALLRDGEYTAALTLADRYPDDVTVDIMFGRVLALYQLGRKGDAAKTMFDAAQYRPLVFEYLLSKKVRRPKIDDYRITLGGKDEAWIYREQMRDVWLAIPGMQAWLEGMNARLRRRD